MKWKILFCFFFFFLSLLFLTMIKRFLHLQRLLKTIHGISGNYSALHCSQLLNPIKEPLAADVWNNYWAMRVEICYLQWWKGIFGLEDPQQCKLYEIQDCASENRPGDKEGMEITLNGSIPRPQKKESRNEIEYGNDAAGMNTKDSSPEEQTESLLQSWSAFILCYCALLLPWLQERKHGCPKACNFWAFLACFAGFFLVWLVCGFCFSLYRLAVGFPQFLFSIVQFCNNKETNI